MPEKELTGVFLGVHGVGAKYVLRRKVGPFHDQYDVYRPWEKIDIVRDLVKLLDREFDDFLEKFAAVDKKHYQKSSQRTRHYISTELTSLYPGKDESFCRQHSFSYKGYWIGTNIGAREITQYVREMCEACNVTFGSWGDLKL
jgi:hypothetical protein